MPVFALGCGAIALAFLLTTYLDNPGREFRRDLRELRREVAGDADPARMTQLIETLAQRAEAHPQHLAEFHYLAGTFYYRQAENDPRASEGRALAAKHLTQALTLNVSEDDLPTLQYRLGMTQFRQGQHPAQALAWIKQGLDQGADDPGPGYAFLVEAYLKPPHENLAAALAASQKHLEYVDDRDREAMARARHRHAEILARLERRDEALRELEYVAPDVSAPLLAKIRLLQASCAEAENLWPQALRFWQDLQPLAQEVPGGLARVEYALGLAHALREPADAAAALAHWRKAARLGGDEGQAAALRLGNLLLTGPQPNVSEALEWWGQALKNVRMAGDYANRHLSLTTVTQLLTQSHSRLIHERQYEPALTVIDLLGRLEAPGQAAEKRARTNWEWGNDLVARAAKDPEQKERLLLQAWSRFQSAGDDFAQATLSRDVTGKIDLHWLSATSYLAGKDFVKAARALEKFIALTANDPRLAQGHFSLAETYQAQGQKNQARAHLLKCIELNVPPYDQRARFRLARQEIDGRNLAAAREILVPLVQRVGPDLERDLHEKSLYLLANVQFELEEYDESAVRLRDALRRFPDNPEALKVRDRLGEYFWEKKAKAISAENTLAGPPERRPLAEAMRLKRREYLEEALKVYQELDGEFEARFQKRASFTSDELWIWRKALFSIGLLRMELDEYAAALDHFRSLQRRYRGIESLFAARNIYVCWKQLSGGDERHPLHTVALEVIQHAARDLESIPRDREEEVFGEGPTDYTRADWQRFLRRWESELRHVTLRINTNSFAPQD